MASLTAEKETLYELIRLLPDDKVVSAIDYVRFLAEDEEPPLTEEELAQIEASKMDIAAGNVSSWEEVKRRLVDLP